jgi:hypothetical protein
LLHQPFLLVVNEWTWRLRCVPFSLAFIAGGNERLHRHREKKLENKKKSYAVATGKIVPQKFEIVPDTYRAELVIYGKMPNKLGLVNGGVKAIKVNVYHGSNLAFESDITRTAGMVQRDLEALIDNVLEQLNQQFQIRNFGEIIWKQFT